jgi:release factor glutamine methyltransferase
VTWADLRSSLAEQLRAAGVASPDAEAGWLIAELSGHPPAEMHAIARLDVPARAAARAEALLARRLAGEPLQYVLGGWSFRSLDLMVDARVLIPRPETERVVEVALVEAERRGLRRLTRRRHHTGETVAVIADLGTGSGAIALALATELADVEVWATDVSSDALAVARLNASGNAVGNVRFAEGDWFDALPADLRGRLTLVVSNPPYVAEHEVDALPSEVIDHEPRVALVSGSSGHESLQVVLRDAPDWLAPGGAVVLEIAPHQAEQVRLFAERLGYVDVSVHDDLTGRPRAVVATLAGPWPNRSTSTR